MGGSEESSGPCLLAVTATLAAWSAGRDHGPGRKVGCAACGDAAQVAGQTRPERLVERRVSWLFDDGRDAQPGCRSPQGTPRARADSCVSEMRWTSESACRCTNSHADPTLR